MSSTFFQRTFLIVLLISIVSVANSQEYKYEIGGMAGGAFYMGDLNKNTPFKELGPSIGAVFRYNPHFRVAIKANLTWAQVSGSTEGLENVFPDQAQGSFSRNLFDLGGQFEFNFLPYSDKFAYLNTKRLSPYILAGIGLTVAPGGETFFGPNIPIGIGVKYKMKNRLNLGLEFTVRKLFGDNFDVTDDGNGFLDDPYRMQGSLFKNKDWYSFLHLSLTWDFGPRNRPCNNIKSIY